MTFNDDNAGARRPMIKRDVEALQVVRFNWRLCAYAFHASIDIQFLLLKLSHAYAGAYV